jgi:hypothetical protein
MGFCSRAFHIFRLEPNPVSALVDFCWNRSRTILLDIFHNRSIYSDASLKSPYL